MSYPRLHAAARPSRAYVTSGPSVSPVFVRNSVTSATAGATSLGHTLNIVDTKNGVWLLVLSTKNNDTHATATAGWSKLGQVNSGASYTTSHWIAREGVGDPTFTWTGSVAAHIESAYYKYADGTAISLTPTLFTNSGSTTPLSATTITASANNVRAVYLSSIAQASTLLDPPAGWTEDRENGSATSGIDMSIGSIAIATSGGSSGSTSMNYFTNQIWTMATLELRP